MSLYLLGDLAVLVKRCWYFSENINTSLLNLYAFLSSILSDISFKIVILLLKKQVNSLKNKLLKKTRFFLSIENNNWFINKNKKLII